MKTIIGERIKELMKRRGMNQTELARKSGVSQAMISKIIGGYRRGDSLTIRRIENALGTKPGSIGEEGRMLSLLKSCDECQQRFSEAKSLAKSIFKQKRHPKIVPLPFFTEHGSTHCEVVEKYLNEIIWERKEKSRYDFEPNVEEAMYLLSAVWLHDIGMWYGLWDGEEPEDLDPVEKVVELRSEHEERTAVYIQQKWVDAFAWTEEQKEYLASICLYHRLKHPIGTLEPATIAGHHGDVRLNVLAALLRLASAWHVDESCAPASLEGLYISLGMKGEALQHWKRAALIKSVEKDETDINSKRIKVTGNYPEPHFFGLGRPERGEFDLKDVGDIICGDIREELRSVRPVLLQYPNTCFVDVIHNARRMKALAKGKEQYVALWPYLLSKPFSASEAATALATMLLLALEEGEESEDLGAKWRRKVFRIMKTTSDMRPCDFMIRNLCKKVERIVSRLPKNAESCRELRECLEGFVEEVGDNSNKMAIYALEIIAPRSALVVYGYSTNVEELLTNLNKQHLLYIVDCYKPIGADSGFDQNKKIIKCARDLGFAEVKFLQVHSFASVLKELRCKGVSCKLLLGTHGVLSNGDLLCHVGSHMLAATAKEFDTEVVVFADEMKVLSNEISEESVDRPEKLFSSNEYTLCPEMSNIPYVVPKMDRMPRSLVDFVITERGILCAEDRTPDKKVLNKTRETGKG